VPLTGKPFWPGLRPARLFNDSSYLIIWRKVGREWLIHRDIGSENRVKKYPG